MSKSAKTIIEYRNYELPAYFPVLLLSGENWRISDIPSGRLHFHNCLEIGICESDTGYMEFEDTKKFFQQGDITIVASNVAHTTYSSSGFYSKWTYLMVDVEELFRPFFSLDVIEQGEELRYLISNYSAILSSKSHPMIHQLILAIVDELALMPLNYTFNVRSLFVILINKLLLLSGEMGNLSSHPMVENALVIAPALDYIHQNYMVEFPMNLLADLCHMSPTHFRRTFSTIMDNSPLEYLNFIRIQKATVLLRTTEHPVLTISEEVGFRSLSSFNRHFLKDTGLSPNEYRRKLSNSKKPTIMKYSGWLAPPKN